MSNALNIGNVALTGDSYPALLGFSIPVVDSLEGAFLFGDGVAQMTRNYAPSKADAKTVGTLRTGVGYALFDETGYLNTGIMEAQEMTIVCIGRSEGVSNPAYLGNNLSIVGGGFGLMPQSSGFRGTSIRNAAVESLNVAGDYKNFSAMALVLKQSAPNVATNLSTGVSVAGASSAARTLEKVNPILIGRLPSNAFKTPNEQVAVLIYSKALSDAELTSVYRWAREYAAEKGFAV